MRKLWRRYKKISFHALRVVVTNDKFVLVLPYCRLDTKPPKQLIPRDQLLDGNYIEVVFRDGGSALRDATQEWHSGELKREGEREL